MADPLSGLAVVGVVANIIQLLEFTGKVAQHTHQILHSTSGALKENERLEALAAEQAKLSAAICANAEHFQTFEDEESELSNLATQCKIEAEDLLKQFAGLKLDEQARGVKRTWQGARKATKAIVNKREIKAQHQHLSELNGQLASRLLMMLKNSLAKIHTSVLQEIESSREDTLQAILESKDAILTAFEQQKKDIQDAEIAKRKRKISCILDSLRFSEMTLRRENIQESYPETYEWILKKNSPCAFRRWLRRGTGLFWVSGKAGSGKSTLMKFLARHEKTDKALIKWADGDSVVVVEFYFWYLGSTMQKSVQGLLQSMLYQIVHKCPDLAPILCPQRWLDLDEFENQLAWTESELYEAIETAANLLSSSSLIDPPATTEQSTMAHDPKAPQYKFVFFIDGLDEYTGDQLQLATRIQSWAKSPLFKICVASRPWNVFNIVFKDVRHSLRLEDLTQQDIRHYVGSKLSPTSKRVLGGDLVLDRDPMTADLVETIVVRAHGVFLWVYLVVSSMLRGLAEGDSIRTLLRRVEAFPSDLYEYFKLIFNRVDEIYARQTAQALLMAVAFVDRDSAGDQLAPNFLTYWLFRQGDGDLDAALHGEIIRHSMSELAEMKFETQRFLSACCKDLLCVSRVPLGLGKGINANAPLANGTKPDYKLWLTSQKVEFLHRTVYEFIKSDYLQSLISKYKPACLDQSHFSQKLALSRLRLIPENVAPRSFCFCTYFYDQALHICKAIGTSTSLMANELDRLGEYWLRLPCTGCGYRGGFQDTPAIVCGTLASHGLYRTFNTAMESPEWDPYLYSSSESIDALLQIVLGLGYVDFGIAMCAPGFSLEAINLSVLTSILNSSADPNRDYKGVGYREFHESRVSVWQAFLIKWLKQRYSGSPSPTKPPREYHHASDTMSDKAVERAAALMVAHKANTQAKIPHPVKGRVAAHTVLFELSTDWQSDPYLAID